jgi:hypothetical protein
MSNESKDTYQTTKPMAALCIAHCIVWVDQKGIIEVLHTATEVIQRAPALPSIPVGSFDTRGVKIKHVLATLVRF